MDNVLHILNHQKEVLVNNFWYFLISETTATTTTEENEKEDSNISSSIPKGTGTDILEFIAAAQNF